MANWDYTLNHEIIQVKRKLSESGATRDTAVLDALSLINKLKEKLDNEIEKYDKTCRTLADGLVKNRKYDVKNVYVEFSGQKIKIASGVIYLDEENGSCKVVSW